MDAAPGASTPRVDPPRRPRRRMNRHRSRIRRRPRFPQDKNALHLAKIWLRAEAVRRELATRQALMKRKARDEVPGKKSPIPMKSIKIMSMDLINTVIDIGWRGTPILILVEAASCVGLDLFNCKEVSMRIFEAGTPQQVATLIQHLNSCHDGSVRKLCFQKQRELDKISGALIYPFENEEDRALCDVEMELLLNSYSGAKKDQAILLEFKAVTRLTFSQNERQDYSEIYEVAATVRDDAAFDVSFCSGRDKHESLRLSCKRIVCKEL